MANTFYNEILIDHNQNPYHKHALPGANMTLEGVNPSCGDDIVLQLRVEDGVIREGSFEGDGCAISQASADKRLPKYRGQQKPVEEAQRLSALFLKMIRGGCTPDEIEELEEAGALSDISHMPARVKCAVLGWHTMEEMLKGRKQPATTES